VKTKLVLIAAVFAALVSSAQTNSIIFPELLSPTNSVLMTNAEFRTFSGSKIFFRNDDGYKSFQAAELNTNVLAALHITAAQLESQQAALDAAKQKYKDSVAAYQAEQARQKKLQEQQATDERVDEDRRRAAQRKQDEANPPPHPNVTPRESIGLGI
jgi:exonuclease VII small subunit